jgi:hypothetical protein
VTVIGRARLRSSRFFASRSVNSETDCNGLASLDSLHNIDRNRIKEQLLRVTAARTELRPYVSRFKILSSFITQSTNHANPSPASNSSSVLGDGMLVRSGS